ncbi:nucleopolyhedrovirus P10 family protein [Streptomyces sp. NPDC002671]
MTADRWTQATGRLLPLGGPRDGAWITEGAAGAVLRQAANEVPGARLGTLRITLTDPEDVHEPAVPPPPGALPPGPLRVTADFAATATEPLPETASRLRSFLATAASERLGLAVTVVDLRVTDLLEEGDAEGQDEEVRPPRPPAARETTDPEESRAVAAALAVAGVTRPTGALGRAVRIEERTDGVSLPHRHVRVELAVSADHRAMDVARQVRAAVRDALKDQPTVAVLVTAVE